MYNIQPLVVDLKQHLKKTISRNKNFKTLLRQILLQIQTLMSSRV